MKGDLQVTGTVTAEGFERRSALGDWAEYFPTTESLAVHRVVGLQASGNVSLMTSDAVRVGIVSASPSFVGNKASHRSDVLVVLSIWPGKVKVLVHGPVRAGDTLTASGRHDGMATVRQPGSEARVIGTVIGEDPESYGDNAVIVTVILGVERPASLVSVSSTSSRVDHLAYFEQDLHLSPTSARRMYKAERLQEKGQLLQAMVCYDRVVREHPGCREAKENCEMLKESYDRMTAAMQSAQLAAQPQDTLKPPMQTPSTSDAHLPMEQLRVLALETNNGGESIQILVNGRPKTLLRAWLINGGRAAGSGLAEQILDFEKHQKLCDPVQLGDLDEAAFLTVCNWLETSDPGDLTDLILNDVDALLEVALFFRLDELQVRVDAELSRRAQAQDQITRKLAGEIKQWRSLHGAIKAARVDQDQGSNTAPAYSSYMYEHRSSFHEASPASRGLVEAGASGTPREEEAFRSIISQLTHELEEWQMNFARFAALLKQSGNVVYHPADVLHPGHCAPSLICEATDDGSLTTRLTDAQRKMVGAAVGDRVKKNKPTPVKVQGYRKKQLKAAYPRDDSPPRRRRYDSSDSSSSDDDSAVRFRRAYARGDFQSGRITSIDHDRGSEVGVLWEDGSTSENLHCGKKGEFELIYGM